MSRKTAFFVVALGLVLAAGLAPRAFAVSPEEIAIQNKLTGVTDAIRAAANKGAGVTVGIIDTGVAAPWVGFSSSTVDSKSFCVIAHCSNSLALKDDNGHGTFLAGEIAANVPSVGMVGVAPSAKILAVKVLDANGSGWSSDVATGIVKAVDKGAQVLNLSLGPGGTAQQQAAFYQNLAAAINYAAAKNAVIVFAGGNDAAKLASGQKIYGLTDAALSRLFFVGSTDAKKKISGFSNRPGTAKFVSTSGKSYDLSSLWIMADGENIWGASNYKGPKGYSYVTQMSGTSMAAPQGAGAAALLAARWPFLLSQGTIAQILEKSAQDLGGKGRDDTYGMGFLRVDSAMQPIGGLTVPVKGKMTVASGQIVTSTALGDLNGLSKALRDAVAYDSYMRGFGVGGGVIKTGAMVNSAAAASIKVSGTTAASLREEESFASGGWYAFSGAPSYVPPSTGGGSENAFTQDPSQDAAQDWTFAFTQGGSYYGAGQGSGAALLMNDARWGRGTAFSGTDSGASNALFSLVSDAGFSFFGQDLGGGARFAAGFTRTMDDPFSGSAAPSAEGAAAAYTFAMTKSWTVSVTSALLQESNQLLGAQSAGFLALGDSASTSFGAGSAIDLGSGYKLGFDAASAMTDPSGGSGMIGGISPITGFAVSAAVSKKDFSVPGDALGVQLSKPLRVYSGSATLTVPTGTDNNGNPILEKRRASLVPDGNETDLNLTYARPLGEDGEDITGNFAFSFRQDADNVKGAQDAAAMFRVKMGF